MEPIATGPPKQVAKPSAVPNLDIEATQVDDYNSSGSSYDEDMDGMNTDMDYDDKDLESAKLPQADTEPPTPPNP